MVRVLHINAGSAIFGGVSAFSLNMYRGIDRDRFQFDFLTPDITTYGQYREEIDSYGGLIYEFGIDVSSLRGKLLFRKELMRFLSVHRYDIVHINSGILSFNCIAAWACRRSCDAKVFVHSHGYGGRSVVKELFSYPLKVFLAMEADQMLACSVPAARHMFPKNRLREAVILKNAINADKFRYRPEVREAVRHELQLEGKFVIGHVGRFTPEKNHDFLIDLIKSVQTERKDVVLMLVGEGPLEKSIREKADCEGVGDAALFLGSRSDVHRLFQAMDIFVLPSLFEGFGIVNIEAQVAGLTCVVSKAVPEEVNVTGNVIRLPVRSFPENPVDIWKRKILKVIEEKRPRRDWSDEIRRAGFDIAEATRILENLYEKK